MRFARFVIFSCFLASSAGVFARADSLDLPGHKVHLQFSGSLVRKWQPQEGKLYPQDWTVDAKTQDSSFGSQVGVFYSKKILGTCYIGTGVEISFYHLPSFRTRYVGDPRYPHLNGTYIDTSYKNFKLISMHVPLLFQVPLANSRAVYFNLRVGVVGTFNLKEAYSTYYLNRTDTSDLSRIDHFDNRRFSYRDLRLLFGTAVEFKTPKSPFTILLGIDAITSAVSKGDDLNFLSHGVVWSFNMGVGYCLFRKQTQPILN